MYMLAMPCHYLSHTSRAFTFAAHSNRTATAAAATGTEKKKKESQDVLLNEFHF